MLDVEYELRQMRDIDMTFKSNHKTWPDFVSEVIILNYDKKKFDIWVWFSSHIFLNHWDYGLRLLPKSQVIVFYFRDKKDALEFKLRFG